MEVLTHLHILDSFAVLSAPLVLLRQAAVHGQDHVIASYVHHWVVHWLSITTPLGANEWLSFAGERRFRPQLLMYLYTGSVIDSLTLLRSSGPGSFGNGDCRCSLLNSVKSVLVEQVIDTTFVCGLGRSFLSIFATNSVSAIRSSLCLMASELVSKWLLFIHNFSLCLVHSLSEGLFKSLHIFVLGVNFLRLFLSKLHRWRVFHEIINLNKLVTRHIILETDWVRYFGITSLNFTQVLRVSFATAEEGSTVRGAITSFRVLKIDQDIGELPSLLGWKSGGPLHLV